MPNLEDFLTYKEEKEIVKTIKQAELDTSEEIRVHIEKSTNISHYQRTIEIFKKLKMFKTKHHNGVLIYVAIDDKKIVVYGDQGIDSVVENDFWNSTKYCIEKQFKVGNYKKRIIDGIHQIGKELKKYFPWNKNDTNELPDTISKN